MHPAKSAHMRFNVDDVKPFERFGLTLRSDGRLHRSEAMRSLRRLRKIGLGEEAQQVSRAMRKLRPAAR
jgi:hypothetical protein